jgi:hypothetical protein
MSEKASPPLQSQKSMEDHFKLKDVQILEYAFSTLKQYGYQSLIGTFETLMDQQISDKNNSKLAFEIMVKTQDDDNSIKPFAINIAASDIKSKVEELIEHLKKPTDEELGDKEDWQMVIEIPYETTPEQLENQLDTDIVFCYLALQSWINNYTNEDHPFLFNRSTLKAGLRINNEDQSKQLVFVFYDFKYNQEKPKEEQKEKDDTEQQEKLILNDMNKKPEIQPNITQPVAKPTHRKKIVTPLPKQIRKTPNEMEVRK